MWTRLFRNDAPRKAALQHALNISTLGRASASSSGSHQNFTYALGTICCPCVRTGQSGSDNGECGAGGGISIRSIQPGAFREFLHHAARANNRWPTVRDRSHRARYFKKGTEYSRLPLTSSSQCSPRLNQFLNQPGRRQPQHVPACVARCLIEHLQFVPKHAFEWQPEFFEFGACKLFD